MLSFLRAYEGHAGVPVDRAMVRRARGWALLFCLSMLAIGRAGERGLPGGKVSGGAAGRAKLDRVVDFGVE